MATAFAHSSNTLGIRQPLGEHLLQVAEQAKTSATSFGGGDLAYYAGLLHDIGKYAPDWQRYLIESEAGHTPRGHGPDHKGAGACLAQTLNLAAATLLVKGHHGGLPALGDMAGWLRERLADPTVRAAINTAQALYPALQAPPTAILPEQISSDQHASELFIRLVFSALVDADFLDTERHFAGGEMPTRGGTSSIAELMAAFERDQRERTGQSADPVNAVRHAVYLDCLAAADLAPGFFRLTAPTGIGKTRSSLAFALWHAQRHDLRRVIYAIPYTSITEQTANVFRAIFTDMPRAVLEHHSAISAPENPENPTPTQIWARLAAENWDAPLIVTTTVQLFESLMAASTSACRKLHNVARGVIILDEAQMLPARLLDPILDALRFLVAHAGVSVVLCTATQPALDDSPQFQGLPDIREIVREPERHFQALKRVEYTWPRGGERWSWSRVAEEMRTARQALAIVNTRGDALTLWQLLDDPAALHLSTWMCGAHRRAVLEEVRGRLGEGKPCLLVSTQVIEAGVDVDFPLVLRAIGPLDRIVQAAGRCNREGRLQGLGHVVIFESEEGKQPRGAYVIGTQETRALLLQEGFDFHDPAVYRRYFERWYRDLNTDEPKIQLLRQGFDYPAVAKAFQMIDEATSPVVVRWQPGGRTAPAEDLLNRLRDHPAQAREHLRALQPYLVSLSTWGIKQAQERGLVAEIAEMPGLYEWLGLYDPTTGIMTEGPLDVERFIH